MWSAARWRPCRTCSAVTSLGRRLAEGLGHFTRIFGTRPVTAQQGVQRVRDLRRARRVHSTGRFPPSCMKCLTGFTTYQATVYPTALAWAATFDPALVKRWLPPSVVTWRPSASIKGCRRCSTWFVIIDGVASRRPWAKTLPGLPAGHGLRARPRREQGDRNSQARPVCRFEGGPQPRAE